MTNTYFKTKEQYFQFRANFAAAAKNVKSKSTCEACDEWLEHEGKLSYDTGMSRVQGWLRAEHFIFLNIVRGKHIRHGFTPITNKNKLSNGGNIWQGFDDGIDALRRVAHSANDVKQIPSNASSTGGGAFKEFIEPLLGGDEFLNVIYMEILSSLEESLKEEVKYYTSFGEGVKVAKKMIEDELKPKNYQEFMQIVEEVENAHETRLSSAA